MAAALTVRLPTELDERLAAYCVTRGAVKNRVVAIALRSFLEDNPPALSVQPPGEEGESGLAA